MRARKPNAVRNEARGTWVCFPIIEGKRTTRKLGNLNELTRQQADQKAAEMFRSLRLKTERTLPTTKMVVNQYRIERLRKLRASTQRAAESWLKGYVLPRWGGVSVIEMQPRPVQLWLESLPLAAKTKGHIKGLLSCLVDYAMWAEMIPIGVNPISLVTVKGSSKRQKPQRSFTDREFQEMCSHLEEPFVTMARLQLCLGLRVSEVLALRWHDVDWLGSKLNVEHGIVNQCLDFVKTEGSHKTMILDRGLLSLLSAWKQKTQFGEAENWMFPSPVKLGRQPISYTCYKTALQEAASKCGISRIGTHSLRHTFRSWLANEGTDPEVQQRLMRHSDIRTTMMYGEVDSDEMQEARSKIARRALIPE